MQIGGKIIKEIKTFSCGSCRNELSLAFKTTTKEKRDFPATAVLFRHFEDIFIIDCGYSDRVLKNGWKSVIYNRLNPVHYKKDQAFKEQLLNDGVDLSQIKGIFLSHLHPDHIGGLKDFPDIPIFLSNETYKTYQNDKLFDLIFKNLIPDDFEERLSLLDLREDIDFFKDQSLILHDVSGHTRGQMAFFFTEANLFYAADACWGMDLMDKELRFPARFLQKDMTAYKKSLQKLRELQNMGIRVVVSHDLNL